MSKSAVPQHYSNAKRSYKPAQTAEPGFTLNKLNPDDFHEICGLVERIRNIRPDSLTPPLPHCLAVSSRVLTEGGIGEISGYAVDAETGEITQFARVNGRLYHHSVLKRA